MNFTEIADKVKRLNFSAGKYALFGSVPLAAYGIRDAKDIDIIVIPEFYNELKKTENWREEISPRGNKMLIRGDIEIYSEWNFGSYNPSVRKLIDEARSIDGVPVVELEEVRKWKMAFGRRKDQNDVRLIEKARGKG